MKELEEPLKRVAGLTLIQQKKDKEEEINVKVRAKADKKLAKDITTATKDPKLIEQVQAQADRALKRKIAQKVAERTKEEVNKRLGNELTDALKAKYGDGTMKDAISQVKMNDESKIRNEVAAKMKVKSEKLAGPKIVAAKLALRKSLKKSLSESFYAKYKKDGAAKLKEDTQGMSITDKKAAELEREKSYKSKADTAAEKQAEVELAGEKGEQLEKRIKLEELTRRSRA